MSAMASPHDVDPAVGAHVLPRAQDLLRSHAGQDEHDPQLVLQARVDRGAPDDPRVRRDAALDDLGDLLGLGDAHVVPARDVHQGSGRGADVDVDQGRIDRLFDRCARTGAPPVPVPPPRPHVMKTMSAPWTTDRSSSAASRADSSPTWGSAPAPRPRVTRRPRRSLCGDRMMRRCWASVFAAKSSAPTIPDSTSRSIVLQPPPPMPTILMFVLRLARIRSSSASSAPTPIVCVGDSGSRGWT